MLWILYEKRQTHLIGAFGATAFGPQISCRSGSRNQATKKKKDSHTGGVQRQSLFGNLKIEEVLH